MENFVTIANTLKVSKLSKKEALRFLDSRMQTGDKTFVTTLYSEFLYAALRDRNVANVLNTADLAVADGIGVLWAAKYLSIPFGAKNFYLKIIEGFFQGLFSGLRILLTPGYVRTIIPEKIVGADLIWDLCLLAAKNNKSVFLLGGFGETPKIAADILLQKTPGLKVAGWSNKNPTDKSVLSDIVNSKADILLVAFGPIKQEQWISEHLNELPVNILIGLGGTFDYIAGEKVAPPKLVRNIGLEWLYRLLTQPKRLPRIVNATWGLCLALLRVKVFSSMPFRKNVVSVVINEKRKLLVYQRNPKYKYNLVSDNQSAKSQYENYWQLPQGGLEKNESHEEAARRELTEELCLKDLKFLAVSEKSYSYVWDNALRPLIFGSVYRYKGQEQKILYFLANSTAPIRVDGDEVIGFEWVAIPNVLNKVNVERKALTEMVVDDLNKNEELKKALSNAKIR